MTVSTGNWYAALALAATLLAGAAAGFMVGRSAGERAASHRKQPILTDMTLLGLSRGELLDSLQLTAAQRVLVDSLLEDAARRAEAAVDTLMTGVRAITGTARAHVRSVLDERQRARFDALLSRIPPLRMRTPVPPRKP
jgi:hypothetical protein